MEKLPLHCVSEYVAMTDGVRLAVTAWLPVEVSYKSQNFPVVLITTRYWRAIDSCQQTPSSQPYYPLAVDLARRGYVLVVADARGTGASFGTRSAETDHNEVVDIGEIVEWVAQNFWCDGHVVTSGCSYSAITTLYSLVSAPPALKLGFCRSPDFDMYRHLFAPGGIVNRWFVKIWGAVTAAQDANDGTALFANGYWPVPTEGKENDFGVLPVDCDQDGSQLEAAVREHRQNFNIADNVEAFDFIDGFLTKNNPPLFSPSNQQAIEASGIPLVIRCGWHDAGTALGALAMYVSFKANIRVILGPCNHEGTYLVDPFLLGDGTIAKRPHQGEAFKRLVATVDSVVKDNKPTLPAVEYFTLGENRWKTSEQWPLPHTQMQRWYLAGNHQLTQLQAASEYGNDVYQVDSTATTGRFNRWFAQSPDQPVLFLDRQTEDKKLLIYDTRPLERDTEITGHPVIHLYLSSSATDGQFFVYLETIDPDGRVRLLTEGQLRGLHRKISRGTRPYKMFGPYHSFKEQDAMLLDPNEVTEITFDLLPISVLLQKGQRIRVAIAGADADTFDPIIGCETPTLTLERNFDYSSYIDLPIINISI